MKNSRLKKEILFGAIGISVFTIVVSMTAVIYIIDKQNEEISFKILRNSFQVIFDDLSGRQNHLLAAARQLAKTPQMGLTVKYMVNYGKFDRGNISLRSTYRKLTFQVKEICRAAKIWKIAVYDYQRDLMLFAVASDNGAFAGYAEGFPKPVFQVAFPSSNEKTTWKERESFEMIKLSLDKSIPMEEKIQFERVGPFVCLVVYTPIQYVGLKEKENPSGVVKAIVPLDHDFVNRLSLLTDTKINVFSKTRFSVGTFPDYKKLLLDGEELNLKLSNEQESSLNEHADLTVHFSEITQNGVNYVQAAYPLMADNITVGAITTLYSKEVAEKNTLQMIKIVILIASICICIIIPMAFLFSNTISKPVNEIVTALKDGIANGDFTKEIHIRKSGEIGDLVFAFQSMQKTISRVSEELNLLIASIQDGKLDFRANTKLLSGEWRKLIIGVNNVVDAFAEPINVTSRMLDSLAKGEIPEKISEDYNGDFNLTISNLNKLIEATNVTTRIAERIADGNLTITVRERSEQDRMMKALNVMIQAVGKGSLDVRGNAIGLKGGWRDIVVGVNRLIEELSRAVSESATLTQEMELARKIQISLLPDLKQYRHPDFTIAADMLPADLVGGDFYDIAFDKSNKLWFAIGDVSGHGVTSGLIMMMAQTVFTTILNNHNYTPEEVVARINKILYKNVNTRLKERHFMTFTALKYIGHGNFLYAGAHLTMLLFRKSTGTVEFIRTTGVYLNFKEDISRATQNARFSLDAGDILVIYTDGLTEAENQQGKMLDLDGFVNIVEKHIDETPVIMKDRIIADVTRWCNNRLVDDMTLVIVKRKGDSYG